MESGRTKSDQDVFLGTADIIHRVEMAQARPLSRWLSGVRIYVVLAFSLGVAVITAVSCWHSMVARGRIEAQAAKQAKPNFGETASDPVHGTPGQAVRGADFNVQKPALPPQKVHVMLGHQAGAIWLDGIKMVDKNRSWSGRLPPGNHLLAVRVGGHMMRHTFVVGGQSLIINVDVSMQSFIVSSGHSGHKTGRSRSY